MVYTTALVLGHGGTTASVSEEMEEDQIHHQSLVEMIGNFLSQLVVSSGEKVQKNSRRRGSLDSQEDDHETTEQNGSPYTTDLCSGLQEEEEGVVEQQEAEARLLQRQVERCLSAAKGSAALPGCEALLLPRRLSARVGRDLLRLSAGEPCGLRGASVHVYLEEQGPLLQGPLLEPLGRFSPEPSVTPTFELSVVFRRDGSGLWPPLRHLFPADKQLKLRPEYRLVKRKLYSPDSPVVVRDFCHV